jgi:hypothetical protein
MQTLQESDRRALAHLLRGWMASHAPDWTGANDSDPGITLLALFAFVTESLATERGALPERGRADAARLASAALLLAGGEGQAQDGPLERNRYFPGRLLGAEDFQVEQDYVRRRLRRHNRALHGAGIVHGLEVSVPPGAGSPGGQVVVQPGFAIAPDGEEIEVRSEIVAGLPECGDQLYVTLSPAERLTRPVAVSGEDEVHFARIEETFSLQVGASAGENGILLARLIRTAAGWQLAKGC